MKNFLLLLVACCMAVGLYAQSKKNSTLVGIQSGIVTPIYFSNASIKNIKLGLPTFSYAASIEKRFSIHNKLNFSFQYSLNYTKQNRLKMEETNYYLKNKSNVSTGINLNTIYEAGKQTSVYAGVGITKAVSGYFSENQSGGSRAKSKTFGVHDFNPSLILGIENNTRIFNRNLFYSLQYNIGFYPFSKNVRTENGESNSPSCTQGLHFGIKYKY